jgi:periplasmic protein TonB
MAYTDEDDESFFQRNRGLVIGIAVLLLGGVGYLGMKALNSGHSTSSSRDDDMRIALPPPPPPPPPKQQPTPPPQQQPTPEQQEQKMVEQIPTQEEKKEEAPKEKPDAPAPLGTSITGPGGGADLGLGSGLGSGGGWGNGGGGGSKYGWYASEVQNGVADALRSNPKTRKASMNVVVRIWADASGHVTKVRLAGTTGDTPLDNAIQGDVLGSLQFKDAPPADMPMPIVMRLSAQRPH